MITLDKQQQQIVDSDASRICVIAGAGSGKTGTTIERIRRLLKDGNDPSGFVCITFTKMAAQEMRSRLSDIPGHEKMFIGTIHSLAYNILAKSGIRANLLTPDKERTITRTLIEKYAKHLTLEKYDDWASKHRLMELGYYKREEVESILNVDEAEELEILFDHIDLKHIYESMRKEDVEKLIRRIRERESNTNSNTTYPETMRSVAQRLGMITFNGLLEECNKSSYNQKIKYLFVDEFQDVGAFEYKFLLGLNAENIFVVGDDYQCQPANTRVTMANGAHELICNINKGDKVLSFDTATNELRPAKVMAVSSQMCCDIVRVTVNNEIVTDYTNTHKTIVIHPTHGLVELPAFLLSIGDVVIKHEGKDTFSFATVTDIQDIHKPTLVYSLHVSPNGTYVADDIVTHNSIYSFKGADFEYFKKLANDEGFTTYKMENNYRCEKHIVDFGDKIISQINDVIPKKCVSKVKPLVKGSLTYKQGNIKTVESFLSYIDERDYGKWFVLTRSNNDMIDISRMCYRKNIPTVTFKKGNMTSQEMEAALAENSIKLLTVHSAKGLESENVLLYGNFPLDQTAEYWEERGTEECRIFYVGATRAKNNLVVISNNREIESC